MRIRSPSEQHVQTGGAKGGSRHRRGLIVALGLAGAAVLALAASTTHIRSAASQPVAKSAAVRLPPRSRAAGFLNGPGGPHRGTPPDLRIEVIPDAVLQASSGKQTLEYHLELQAELGGDAKYKYQVDFYDDLGQSVGKAKTSAAIATSAGAPAVMESFTTPEELPDGFYQAHITAAGKGSVRSASYTSDVYFEVVKGQVFERDMNDWHKRSRSNLPTVN
jgi:hypothetical protein